ncbi:Aste57867_10728 [Aphanomyces stellatus]|uniref:Protein transport protein sec16 n=1 Tax=Aphanomyces stellatus TaxID=120398 RepID=A0A485KRK0_9STRA|nr:hypothetical protein As57867_010688 [Aphanomyces stellatus]VFT87598.1 Aste57867_10728 [Aphanomyces stellatus]
MSGEGQGVRSAYGPPSNTESEGWEVVDQYDKAAPARSGSMSGLGSPRARNLSINPHVEVSNRTKSLFPTRAGPTNAVPSRVVDDLLSEHRMTHHPTRPTKLEDFNLFADDMEDSGAWGTDSPSNLLGNDDDLDFEDDEEEQPATLVPAPPASSSPSLAAPSWSPHTELSPREPPAGAFGDDLDLDDDEDDEVAVADEPIPSTPPRAAAAAPSFDIHGSPMSPPAGAFGDDDLDLGDDDDDEVIEDVEQPSEADVHVPPPTSHEAAPEEHAVVLDTVEESMHVPELHAIPLTPREAPGGAFGDDLDLDDDDEVEETSAVVATPIDPITDSHAAIVSEVIEATEPEVQQEEESRGWNGESPPPAAATEAQAPEESPSADYDSLPEETNAHYDAVEAHREGSVEQEHHLAAPSQPVGSDDAPEHAATTYQESDAVDHAIDHSAAGPEHHASSVEDAPEYVEYQQYTAPPPLAPETHVADVQFDHHAASPEVHTEAVHFHDESVYHHDDGYGVAPHAVDPFHDNRLMNVAHDESIGEMPSPPFDAPIDDIPAQYEAYESHSHHMAAESAFDVPPPLHHATASEPVDHYAVDGGAFAAAPPSSFESTPEAHDHQSPLPVVEVALSHAPEGLSFASSQPSFGDHPTEFAHEPQHDFGTSHSEPAFNDAYLPVEAIERVPEEVVTTDASTHDPSAFDAPEHHPIHPSSDETHSHVVDRPASAEGLFGAPSDDHGFNAPLTHQTHADERVVSSADGLFGASAAIDFHALPGAFDAAPPAPAQGLFDEPSTYHSAPHKSHHQVNDFFESSSPTASLSHPFHSADHATDLFGSPFGDDPFGASPSSHDNAFAQAHHAVNPEHHDAHHHHAATSAGTTHASPFEVSHNGPFAHRGHAYQEGGFDSAPSHATPFEASPNDPFAHHGHAFHQDHHQEEGFVSAPAHASPFDSAHPSTAADPFAHHQNTDFASAPSHQASPFPHPSDNGSFAQGHDSGFDTHASPFDSTVSHGADPFAHHGHYHAETAAAFTHQHAEVAQSPSPFESSHADQGSDPFAHHGHHHHTGFETPAHDAFAHERIHEHEYHEYHAHDSNVEYHHAAPIESQLAPPVVTETVAAADFPQASNYHSEPSSLHFYHADPFAQSHVDYHSEPTSNYNAANAAFGVAAHSQDGPTAGHSEPPTTQDSPIGHPEYHHTEAQNTPLTSQHAVSHDTHGAFGEAPPVSDYAEQQSDTTPVEAPTKARPSLHLNDEEDVATADSLFSPTNGNEISNIFGGGSTSTFDHPPSSLGGFPPSSSGGASSLFGASNLFTQPPASQTFGQPPSSQSFGQPPSSQTFGQPPKSQSFGQALPSQTFGQPPSSQTTRSQLPPKDAATFSQPAQSQDEQPAASELFGQSQSDDPFGRSAAADPFGYPPAAAHQAFDQQPAAAQAFNHAPAYAGGHQHQLHYGQPAPVAADTFTHATGGYNQSGYAQPAAASAFGQPAAVPSSPYTQPQTGPTGSPYMQPAFNRSTSAASSQFEELPPTQSTYQGHGTQAAAPYAQQEYGAHTQAGYGQLHQPGYNTYQQHPVAQTFDQPAPPSYPQTPGQGFNPHASAYTQPTPGYNQQGYGGAQHQPYDQQGYGQQGDQQAAYIGQQASYDQQSAYGAQQYQANAPFGYNPRQPVEPIQKPKPAIFKPQPAAQAQPVSYEQHAPRMSRELKQQYQPPTPQAATSPAVFNPKPQQPVASRPKDPSVLPRGCLATIGFGGNVCVMFPKRKLKLLNTAPRNSPRPLAGSHSFEEHIDDSRKGPLEFYKMDQLHHPSDSFYQKIRTFPGPLSAQVTDDAVLKYMSAQSTTATHEDERLLWELLQVLVKSKGKISTRDAQVPDMLLMQVLQNSVARRTNLPPYDTVPPPPAESHGESNSAKLRQLLLDGDRKGAIDVAMAANLWPQAMLMASYVDPELYKSVVQAFVTSRYGVGDPLRTLFLVFGDLEAKSLHEPKPLLETQTRVTSSLVANWLTQVQVLVANPTKDTNRVLMELGDRLLRETSNVWAAHVCFLLSGVPVEAPSPTARMSLVGGQATGDARFFVRPNTIQWTEIYEHVAKQASGAAAPPLVPFQGYKFIYATLLADAGCCELAFKYVDAMRKTLDQWMVAQKMQSPYLDNLKMQLDVFDDRLRFYMGQDRVEAAETQVNKRGFFGSIAGFLDKSLDKIVNDTPAPKKTVSAPIAGTAFAPHMFPPAPGSNHSSQAAPNSQSGNPMGGPPSSHNSMNGGNGYNQAAPNSQHQYNSHATAPGSQHQYNSNGGTNNANLFAAPPGSTGGHGTALPPRPLGMTRGMEGAPASAPHPPLKKSNSFTYDNKAESKAAAESGPASEKQPPAATQEKPKAKTPPTSSSSGSQKKGGWFSSISLPSLGLADAIRNTFDPVGEGKVVQLPKNEPEPYFDKEKNRWIFPGEENEADAAPPSAPPTSFPATTPGGGPPGSNPPGSATPSMDSDPLAALMAPPPMKETTPLAAMMAPPPRSMYGSQRSGSMNTKKTPPRPQFTVFKPNPATAAAAPMDPPPSGDSAPPSSSGGGQ